MIQLCPGGFFVPAIPVLVQILAIFALVVFASAKKVHLGLAALAGGVIFGFFQDLSPKLIALTILQEIFDPDTLLLLGLMVFIMAFSIAMKKAGALDAFNNAVRAITRSANAALPIAPLLIGTLPMPGGAVLSAPLVEALDPDRTQGAERLSAINYWFRHNLELSWPLYPAFILTSTLANLSVGRLMLLNLYAPVCLFTLGTIFIMKRTKSVTGKAASGAVGETNSALSPLKSPLVKAESRLSLAIRGFAPLAMVLGTYVLLDVIWRLAAPQFRFPVKINTLIGRFFPILTGLSAGSLFIVLRNKGQAVFKNSITSASIKMVAVIAGIRCFSALLETGGVAVSATAELAALGISPLIVAVLLPFIAGLITGVGFGYVGLAFPIVLGLFSAGGNFPQEAVVVLRSGWLYRHDAESLACMHGGKRRTFWHGTGNDDSANRLAASYFFLDCGIVCYPAEADSLKERQPGNFFRFASCPYN